MGTCWHWFTFEGRLWLLDVPSTSLFEIDRPTAAVLDWLEEHPQQGEPPAIDGVPKDELGAILGEIHSWRESGLLSEENPVRPPERTPSLKALCLHVSHDCNLRCRYCFGSTGSFGGKRLLMDREVGCRAIDLLLADSGERNELEVDFFGGEPLMNMPVVRELVRYGDEASHRLGKRIHFTLTTNGVALTGADIDYLNSHNISLVLSHDGRPEVHDRMRPMPGGRPSSAMILQHIRAAVASRDGKDYYVRGTFTRENTDFAADVQYLYEQGFRRISVEPVVGRPEEPCSLREEDLPGVFAEYERLAGFFLSRVAAGDPMLFFHFAVDLDHGPCVYKRLNGCGAGFDYLAVTPEGDLYPCHQFVGRSDYRMGDVRNGIVRSDLRNRFGQTDIFHKHGCSGCWARYFCSGGCHANADLINGDILKPDPIGCALMKKRLECALGIRAVQATMAEEPRSKDRAG